MIILRQKIYSSKSTQALHKIVTARRKLDDTADKVSHAVRKALTKDELERNNLDLLYKGKKKTDIAKLRDTIATKNNIKGKAKSLIEKTKNIVSGVTSPGETVSDLGEFISDHPSSLLATAIPCPGSAETWAVLVDSKIQDEIPAYKTVAEKTGKLYRKHLKKGVKNIVDGGIQIAKHVAGS